MALQVVQITSWDDPRVDVYRDVRDADLRGRDGLFMAESELVVRRLLKMPQRLHSLLLSPEKFARLREALEEHLPETVPVYVAELRLMHEIAAFHIHRGTLAAGYRLPAEALSLDAALGHLRPGAASASSALQSAGGAPHSSRHLTLLLCEGVTNVDNMGALFRNAAAFGVQGVVLDPTCCDPLYRKAIRVSMGHVLSIPYAVSDNWPADIARLRDEWGMTIVAAEVHERAKPLWNMPQCERMGLLFGSEGHGLTPAALQLCDAVCEIPMADNVPSINVAVASAVFLYERRRGKKAVRYLEC